MITSRYIVFFHVCWYYWYGLEWPVLIPIARVRQNNQRVKRILHCAIDRWRYAFRSAPRWGSLRWRSIT